MNHPTTTPSPTPDASGTESPASRAFHPSGTELDKLQKLEDRIGALQMQAELFGAIPFLPQKLRRFMADLVAVLASMTAAIDALQAARDQVPGGGQR